MATDKSYIILTTQADHTFIPILSVWGFHKFWLIVTNHEGQQHSMVYELASPTPISASLAFLQIIVNLCFTDKQYIGYDPTMTTNNFGLVKSIKCCSKIYKVICIIYETQSFVGHATRVWEVEHDNQHLILKDAWVKKSHPCQQISAP